MTYRRNCDFAPVDMSKCLLPVSFVIILLYFCGLLQLENPQTFSDMVEVLMIQLRKLCELKQKDHTHISDSNRYPWKHEVGLYRGWGGI